MYPLMCPLPRRHRAELHLGDTYNGGGALEVKDWFSVLSLCLGSGGIVAAVMAHLERRRAEARDDKRRADDASLVVQREKIEEVRKMAAHLRATAVLFRFAANRLKLAAQDGCAAARRSDLLTELDKAHEEFTAAAPDALEQLSTDLWNAATAIRATSAPGTDEWWQYMNARRNFGFSLRRTLHSIQPYPEVPEDLRRELAELGLYTSGELVSPDRRDFAHANGRDGDSAGP